MESQSRLVPSLLLSSCMNVDDTSNWPLNLLLLVSKMGLSSPTTQGCFEVGDIHLLIDSAASNSD